MKQEENNQKSLYNPAFEHDNCGIGAVVNIDGERTHLTVSNALKIVEQLEHRAGKDAKGETGDGVGILTQIPHAFLKKISMIFLCLKQDVMVWECSFFHRINLRVIKQKECLNQLSKKKEWIF